MFFSVRTEKKWFICPRESVRCQLAQQKGLYGGRLHDRLMKYDFISEGGGSGSENHESRSLDFIILGFLTLEL